ncbi:MAG TPA: glycosyltransferase family 4 protein [Bacteroidia bacterium]|nr:glycosyltransferase family 4 protein [Bacteroidia bacterium]
MRIALITDGIWPYVLGGMQKHSYYLCKYLAANKIQVDLFHFNRSTYDIAKLEFFSEEEKKYIRSVIVDFPSSSKLPGHYIRNSKLHSKLIYEALKDDLSTYDFIYTKGFTGWHLIEQKKAGKIKCGPIGVKFHGYEMFQKMPGPKAYLDSLLLLRKPVKYITRNADKVFSYGGKVTDIVRKLGVEEKKIIEIPSGVEESVVLQEIIPSSEKLRFLYLGRYERRKGIEELNKALKSRKRNDFEFHFVGPIPEEKRLKEKYIVYHGEIRDKKKLSEVIQSCQVLVCPSWSEGLPNVILEAMANGLAVIATDVGATRILVSDANGILLSDSQPSSIQTAMNKLLDLSPSEIEKKRSSSLAKIKKEFTWEILVKKLLVELEKR